VYAQPVRDIHQPVCERTALVTHQSSDRTATRYCVRSLALFLGLHAPMQGCLSHMCNQRSLPNSAWHLVLTSLARIEFKDTFPDLPPQNKSTLSRLVNRFSDTGTVRRIASNMRKTANPRIAEGGGHLQRLTRFYFDIIIFSTNRICVKNRLRDFSIALYMLCTCRSMRYNESITSDILLTYGEVKHNCVETD
jgi:hypothetical protein